MQFRLAQHTRQTRSRDGRLNLRLPLRLQDTWNERKNLFVVLGFYKTRFLEAPFPENTAMGAFRTFQHEFMSKAGIA